MGLFGDILGTDAKTKLKNPGPAPWTDQKPYLTFGFDQAQDLYKQQNGQPGYSGDMYAGLSPFQQQTLGQITDYVGGQGGQFADAAGNASRANLGAGGMFGSNAQGIFDRSQGYRTNDIIANAGQYANNPHLQSQIDQAIGDVSRNFNENTLQGIQDSAIGNGNTNSTRYGVERALAQRDASNQAGQIATSMRGNAYSTGLGMAAQDAQQQATNQLGANQQLGMGLQTGLSGINQANQMNLGNFDALQAVGSTQQQDAQGEMDAAYNQWMMGQQRPWDLLNNYWNIAAAGSFPTTGAMVVNQPGTTGIMNRVSNGLNNAGIAGQNMGKAASSWAGAAGG